MPVVVEPYDPRWPARFAAEQRVLERILAPVLAAGVHHIGSTSVPGLPAKPIIDMLAGVHGLPGAAAAIEPLRAAGYTHAYHRPDALWFFRGVPGDLATHTHALHLTEPGSDLWRERLTFRDALRADPALLGEYRRLKERLAGEHPDDLRGYTDGKRAFVAAVLARSGVTLVDRRGGTT